MEALIVLISEFILVLVIAGVVFSVVGIFTVVLGGLNLGVKARAKTKKINWVGRLSLYRQAVFLLKIYQARPRQSIPVSMGFDESNPYNWLYIYFTFVFLRNTICQFLVF